MQGVDAREKVALEADEGGAVQTARFRREEPLNVGTVAGVGKLVDALARHFVGCQAQTLGDALGHVHDVAGRCTDDDEKSAVENFIQGDVDRRWSHAPNRNRLRAHARGGSGATSIARTGSVPKQASEFQVRYGQPQNGNLVEGVEGKLRDGERAPEIVQELGFGAPALAGRDSGRETTFV